MATAATYRGDEPLDTTIRLVTPERITFLYPLAGPFHRACAYLIDFTIWIVLLLVVLVVAVLLSVGTGTTAWGGLALVAIFALQWGYGALCEGLFNGQTPGKWVFGLRVVSDQGVPITGGQAFLRNLLWPIEGIPFMFMPAVASMLLTRRFQRLGDLAAGTMVVLERRPPRAGVARVDEPAVEALLAVLPPRLAVGPELARAVSDYVKHRTRFNKARREEMAAHLARPLRARYDLPEHSSGDAVLCAVYRRVYLGD